MLERADHWTPPDSLGYSSLRPVRLTGLGKTLVIFAAATLIGAVVLGVFLDRTARRQTAEQSLLRAQGLPTDAVITRVWRTNGSRKSERSEARNHIAYYFEYAGRRYTSSMQVPTKIWRDLAEGAVLPVRFVPSQPSINHPTAWSSKPLPLWTPYLIVATLAALAVVMLIPLRRQIRLLTEGRPAPGRVTAIKNADKFLVIKYEFRLLNGVVAQGKSNASKAPVAGAPLCVLYDPENPRRNALYPLSLVRLENAPAPPRKMVD
jgi:hypothetical protein